MLQDIAPRLARARDQWMAIEGARWNAIRLERDNVLRLERLVAHRELQEMRAVAACGRAVTVSARQSAGTYLVRRSAALRHAQDALRRARRRLRTLERQR